MMKKKTEDDVNMRSGYHCLLILALLAVSIEPCKAVRKSHFIHWNTTNPIFRIDNTDHIIDVNRGNQPWEYDQVNIICPLYRNPYESSKREEYIIYSVTKEEYESCRITTPNPTVVAQCNKPHELMYFTITFRSFTPIPGGMEFKPGKDYFFISTSSDDDLHRRVGGRCSTHNMKLQFKVAESHVEIDPEVKRRHRPLAINVPRRRQTTTTTTTSTTTTANPPPRPLVNAFDIPKRFPMYNEDLSYMSFGNSVEDDNGRGSYHPNDVIKHEASRMASVTSGASATTLFSLTFSAAVFLAISLILY